VRAEPVDWQPVHIQSVRYSRPLWAIGDCDH
jgi:hypothetical protein